MIFAYGISNQAIIFILFCEGFLLTHAPPTTLYPIIILGSPCHQFCLQFISLHTMGATFLDNVNYVMCYLIQYHLELNKNSLGQFECYINSIA
jgi:hypothetical protein